MSVTFLKNIYSDYSFPTRDESPYINSSREIKKDFLDYVDQFQNKSIQILKTELKNDINYDGTVYTGSPGLALYYFMCATVNNNDIDLLQQSMSYINLKSLKGKKISFLCGDAGPLALATVISYKLKSHNLEKIPNYITLLDRLLSLISLLDDSPDELLYGRSGYLYALLFVKENILEDDIIPNDHIEKVINAIIKSGKTLAAQVAYEGLEDSKSPLMWQWHDKIYLGGAHGICGILYLLLQAREFVSEVDMRDYVRPALDWLLSLRFKSGNFPSSLGSNSGDRLVQWCHGAPGFVPLCLLANKVFKNDSYLAIAKESGEVVWKRGICSKGYSICHGVSGNAYTFIQLYQATKEVRYLHRACCFTEWCMVQRAGSEGHRPDRPASLFEGLVGRLYLAEQMKHIDTAKFPAYTV